MKGLASFILFLSLFGSFAFKGILPSSSAISSSKAQETNTTTTAESLPSKELNLVCTNNADTQLSRREEQLVQQINHIKESSDAALKEIERINKEMQQTSLEGDNVNEAQQKVNQWNETLRNLKQTLVNKGSESPVNIPDLGVDIGYSKTPDSKVTISFEPITIVNNLQNTFEKLTSSNVTNWVADTSQSLVEAAEQINAQAADSVRQLERELDSIRSKCTSVSQTDVVYSYHSAQPDPNLPPVKAIPCDDPRVISNPKHACEIRPGVIRMPSLDY